jgi:TPR repeat protein
MTIHLLNDTDFLENQLTDEDIDSVKINAEEGNALAQYHLGLMFDAGRGVERNAKEAEKWYKKSAEQGNLDAQYFLAKMYSTETSGIPKNDEEAVKLFKAAAEKGHQGAIRRLYN